MRESVTIQLCGHAVELRGDAYDGAFTPDEAYIGDYPDDVFELIGGTGSAASYIEQLAQDAYSQDQAERLACAAENRADWKRDEAWV